jgi:hypothetical protein
MGRLFFFLFAVLIVAPSFTVCASPHVRSSFRAGQHREITEAELDGLLDHIAAEVKRMSDESFLSSASERYEVPAGTQALIPVGLPRTREQIQRAFNYAAFDATFRPGKVVRVASASATVTVPPNTRISTSISGSSLQISFSGAGLLVKRDWVPVTVKIMSVTWSFSRGRFSIRASSWLSESFTTWVTNKFSNAYLIAMVPARIRRAGYNVNTDPDLEGTIKGLASDTMKGSGGASAGVSVSLGDFINAEATVSISLNEGAVHIPIKDKDAEINIPPRTYVSVTGQTTGPLTDVRIQQVRINTGSAGIEIRKSTGVFAPLAGCTLKGININPGGKLSLQYDLHVEDALTGIGALAQLLVVVGSRGREGGNMQIRQARLDSIRKQIDDAVTANADPRIKAMIQQFDRIVPGMSLVKIFQV